MEKEDRDESILMIKYKEIYEKNVLLAKLALIRERHPVKLITFYDNIIYTIPWDNKNPALQWNFIVHTDISTKINDNNIKWAWYGNSAESRKQWLDPEWRKKSEIKFFL